MDTILEALRALKEDFEIIPLTDKEKEEWKNRKELLTKLAETEKGSSLEVTEDIIDIFKKALKEMEESGMPIGKCPNIKVTPLEDAVPVTGEDPEYDKLCSEHEIQESLKELNESLNLNKDFYDKLPSFACEHLDNLISEHGEEDGFEDAGNKYRNHILNSEMEDMKMPGSFFDFNKHLDARTKGAIKKGGIDSETGHAILKPLKMNEDLIIVEADKVKDKLYALKDEIEKAEGNLKFFLMDLFAVYMYHAFGGGVPTSSDERDELKAKGISTDELIHSDLTRKEGDELSEGEKGIDVEFKKE